MRQSQHSMARPAQLLGTCPLAWGRLPGNGEPRVEYVAVLERSSKLWAPAGDLGALLEGTDWVLRLVGRQHRCPTDVELRFLASVQSMAAAGGEAGSAAAKLVPLASLAAKLQASTSIPSRCVGHSLGLQMRLAALGVPPFLPQRLHTASFSEELLGKAHYGMASVAPEQLEEGSQLCTELLLLAHFLSEPATVIRRRQCGSRTVETRLDRVLELGGFAVLAGACRPWEMSLLLYADVQLVASFLGYLDARGVAPSTKELHAKAGLAVVHFMQSVAVAADQAGLSRLEEWYQEMRKSFASEVIAAQQQSKAAAGLHAGQVIHYIETRVGEALEATRAGELTGRSCKRAQAALFLALLGFAYSQPLRSDAVRELLRPSEQLAQAQAALAELRAQHEELEREEGQCATTTRRRRLQGQMALIIAAAARLRTCLNVDCQDAWCLGNRVEVVLKGRSHRGVRIRVIHSKVEDSHGEEVVDLTHPSVRELMLWWVDHGHRELGWSSPALFCNDRGAMFPSSRSLSVYLKASCWNIPGVDICTRSARSVYCTSIRDFMGERPEALKAAERGLARGMLTSLKKWDSHYDARGKGERERMAAQRVHAAYRDAMLSDWLRAAGLHSSKQRQDIQCQLLLLGAAVVALLAVVAAMLPAVRFY